MRKSLKNKDLKIDQQQVIYKSLLFNLGVIKKELGPECTFLSFSKETSKDNSTGELEHYDAFNAVIINKLGGKDRVIYRIDKPIYELTSSDFIWLRDSLNNRMYESGQRD